MTKEYSASLQPERHGDTIKLVITTVEGADAVVSLPLNIAAALGVALIQLAEHPEDKQN